MYSRDSFSVELDRARKHIGHFLALLFFNVRNRSLLVQRENRVDSTARRAIGVDDIKAATNDTPREVQSFP